MMATSIQPFHRKMPRAKFLNLPVSLKCVQCKEVVMEPVQTPCGHLACTDCTAALRNLGRCPANDHEDDECIDIKPDTVFNHDKSAVRELKKLKAFCPFNEFGCEKSLAYKDIQAHIDQCEFKRECCQHDGCEVLLKQTELQSHMRDVCPYRPLPCDHCGTMITTQQKENHLEECNKVPVSCPNHCGASLTKDTLKDHLCSKKKIPCPLSSLGCDDKPERQDVAKHLNTGVQKHWELATQHIVELEVEIASLKNQQLEQIEKSERKIDQLGKSLAEEKETTAKLRQEVVEANNRNHQMQEQLKRNSTTMEALTRRLVVIEQQQVVTSGNAGENATRSMSMVREQLHMLDMRIQCQETTSYDGTLVWRIGDYSRRKRDAKAGTTLSLYSQPFYTSRNGYKMCARVYLNGDGLGKGSYISLFFVLMRGEYDALLRWPFQQRVVMRLLHQDGGPDFWDTFDPDVTSSSFQRPQREMNVASGCPMFVKQTDVDAPGSKYLQNDTLFLKIEVTTDGCHVVSKTK